jgi:hypothetical protein
VHKRTISNIPLLFKSQRAISPPEFSQPSAEIERIDDSFE